MRRLVGWVAASVVMGLLGTGPALAETCPYSGPTLPDTATRTYRDVDLGFAFEIPANYRAMGLDNRRVAFYDPTTFEYVQCAVRNRRTPGVTPAAVLYVNYAPLPENDLLALIQRVRPWLSLYQPTYQAIAPNGVSALQYRYVHAIYNSSVVALSVRSLDQRWLITLEGAPNNPITPLALTTLQR